ncbi:87_t:CDS:2, partial [Racocetra fulgida]
MGNRKNEMIEIPFCTSSEELSDYLKSKRHKFKIKNFQEITNLHEHEGIRSAFNAVKLKLSPNNAYILLLGISGSGKSSTINFLFNKEITLTGDGKSQTKETTEFKAKINDLRLGIKNLGISIIDGPGLEDSKGVEEDAKNILCYKRFLESHPQLASVRPNVIMIVADLNNTRLGDSENVETPFARMLKGIKFGLAEKVLDHKRPSVIFVLTHLKSIPPKKSKEVVSTKTTLIKELSASILGIIDPPVVTIENYPDDWGLERKDDWYILGNNEKHPLNLFEALINLCENSTDHIGQEAISLYFSSASQSDVEPGHRFSVKQLTKDDDNIIKSITTLSEIKLGMDISGLIKIIEDKFLLLPTEIQNELGSSVPVEVASFFRANKITTVQEIPYGDEFLELYNQYLRPSANLLKFLKQALDRKTTETFVDPEFENKQDYIRKRLFDLGLSIDIPLAFVDGKLRHGYSIGSSTNNSNHETEQTFLIERHCFKFTLNIDKLQLSQAFKDDIDILPPKYDKSDE